MAFDWQKGQELGDDWRGWPVEARVLLLESLKRVRGEVDVEATFGRPLHEAQRRIIEEAGHYNVAACGRRFGKSILGQYLITETMLKGEPACWMAPSFRVLADAWRDLKRVLGPLMTEKSEQEKRIVINTGGSLECWSLDDPDAGRSRKYKRVIVDEAAMVAYLGEAWSAAIEPTLLDLEGDAWFLSTPKGANFFRTIYQWGQDREHHPEWRSWQMPTTANTAPTMEHLPAYVERKRLTVPERYFRQEYMAEFIDDAGGVFRNISQAATIPTVGTGPWYAADEVEDGAGWLKVPRVINPDHSYVIGVDWGKMNDFTVLTVINTTTGELVAVDRFNRIDYTVQIQRLYALARRFGTKTLIPELNSIGIPLVEQLRKDGYKVHPFTTSNASKAEIIDSLTLAFERQQLQILDLPVLVDELQAYEAERLPSGMLRYSAPEGYHDDCVMSLALAWHGASIRPPKLDQSYSYSYLTY